MPRSPSIRDNDADEEESLVESTRINLVKRVATNVPFVVNALNAIHRSGVEENIPRRIVAGAAITVLPHQYQIYKIAENFDVSISNDPDDPIHCQETVYNVSPVMDERPLPLMDIIEIHVLKIHVLWKYQRSTRNAVVTDWAMVYVSGPGWLDAVSE